ncbi:helix-turn-helix domain-containing protein [Levilactobacillus tujiorum]|uniref:Helix-turn-helix domain-containing protein n=1 Tax=Levilactobacillus tujiorum TaxID=2912243 RepID=A0ABX1L4C1_9LACO|nr:helix-turn-helix domain-containing protein [Levilactobacillus tujiorum]MCH5464084.1 helix-turn-helix domain-containing protein [Levilactobacillus tujiorum]NLR11184.1 helix-turn-helix domain-containing protein [Lactobacillus sp. HBUAS51387]NLR29189.1 helix-turn-helix domain-containing protein [Levilactobacillus tujiorum]
MKPKHHVIKTIEIVRALTGQPARFTVISLDEVVQVRRREIAMTHTYWVPLGDDLDNDENYLEPINDPDFNLQADFREYRRLFGVLTPQAIREIREGYQLSLRQFALILGMSYSTLSEIENGLVLQTDEQERLFRLSQNERAFADLVQAKRAIMSATQYQKIVHKVALT